MKKKFLFAAFLICGAISSVAEEKPRYKDASLPVEERVEDLLRRMTLHEKVLQLQNNSTSDINAIENTYKGGSPGSVHEMSKSARRLRYCSIKCKNICLRRIVWGFRPW